MIFRGLVQFLKVFGSESMQVRFVKKPWF